MDEGVSWQGHSQGHESGGMKQRIKVPELLGCGSRLTDGVGVEDVYSVMEMTSMLGVSILSRVEVWLGSGENKDEREWKENV